ncbi:platelet endothelial cell adhesion molecule isoform 9-T9 [Cyanocitta cristata]
MYLALLVIFLQCSELYAQGKVFTFNRVEIRVQPSVKVKNGAPMSIICHADISKNTDFQLKHNFTIFKDGKLVFMTVSDKEDARYEIPMAKSSDTGDYECTVKADGKLSFSNSIYVWVAGMTKPILTADKKEVLEGEVVKLRCELPEEVPPLEFFFRKIKTNSAPKEKRVPERNQNFSEVEYYVEEGDNILQFDCFGKRQVRSGWESSQHSNKTLVTVKEPFIKPTLITGPSSNVTEGDQIEFECSTVVAQMRDIEIILQKNRTILNSVRDKKFLKYSTVATQEDSGEYLCKVEQGAVSKTTKLNVFVSAPVSKPTLSVVSGSPEVILGKPLQLICHSVMGTPPITFTFYKGDEIRKNVTNDTYAMFLDEDIGLNDNGRYKCDARNNHSSGVKTSNILNVTVIVPIRNASLGSVPYGEVEVGSDTAFLCSVKEGSWPIDFKFFKKTDHEVLLHEVREYSDRTIWHKKTMKRKDTGTYYCMASNRASMDVRSRPITIHVILAAWQKGVIAAFVLTAIAGAGAIALWWFLHKKKKAKGPSMEMSGSALAPNLTSEKLTRQPSDGNYYSGSGYIEDNENHMKSTDESKGPDLESAEVDYTEVEVSTLDPHRAPEQKGTETVYSEIRKTNNDSMENRHSRIYGHPDAT